MFTLQEFKMKKILLTVALSLAMGMVASAKSVVVYFSAEFGATRAVAEQIAKITGSDILEIKPKVAYTKADLNWRDSNSRTTKECHNLGTVRPELAEKLDISGYDTVYIGYPIWWGEAPNILYTFVESADFSGKTVYPFCTSGSSGVGASAKNLARKAAGEWKGGKRFTRSVSESEVNGWK